MTRFMWDMEEADGRPIHGPACPGPTSHPWTLTITDGSILWGSGCSDCNSSFFPEDVEFEIDGRLVFDHEHLNAPCPNAIRFLPCDCNYWWRFIPGSET